MHLSNASGDVGARRMYAPAYDAEAVTARLAEAAETLAAIPGGNGGPAAFRGIWPFPVVSLGQPLVGDDARSSLPRPSAAAIDAMEEVLAWPQLIPAKMIRERRIVHKRALGWTWHRIGAEVGMSHEGARRAHARGINRIVSALLRRSSGDLAWSG